MNPESFAISKACVTGKALPVEDSAPAVLLRHRSSRFAVYIWRNRIKGRVHILQGVCRDRPATRTSLIGQCRRSRDWRRFWPLRASSCQSPVPRRQSSPSCLPAPSGPPGRRRQIVWAQPADWPLWVSGRSRATSAGPTAKTVRDGAAPRGRPLRGHSAVVAFTTAPATVKLLVRVGGAANFKRE